MADNRISVADYHRMTGKGGGKREGRFGKDRRIKTAFGSFDSIGEYNRYMFLVDCEKRGVIRDLARQVEFPFELNGQAIAVYRADAVYTVVRSGQRVVEDYKGLKKDKETGKAKAHTTEVFTLKKKMLKAFYGIDLLIITKASYWNPETGL